MRTIMRSIHSHPTASHVKLTNSCPSGSSARVRGGYSLMEMLIVLAIMAAMAAFALPSLRGPLDKSRLRSSARQMRAALAKTRSLAIREGVPLVFQFEAGGRSWTIERKGASPLQQSTMTGDSRPLSGLQTGRAATENVLVNSHESSVLRQGLLPEGVTFAESPPLTEQREGNVVADEPADVVGASFSELRSQSISFRPNGRSEDSTVTINGSRDFVVTVTVRGLTSAVSYSSPFRRASINVDDRIAALSDETTQ